MIYLHWLHFWTPLNSRLSPTMHSQCGYPKLGWGHWQLVTFLHCVSSCTLFIACHICTGCHSRTFLNTMHTAVCLQSQVGGIGGAGLPACSFSSWIAILDRRTHSNTPQLRPAGLSRGTRRASSLSKANILLYPPS